MRFDGRKGKHLEVLNDVESRHLVSLRIDRDGPQGDLFREAYIDMDENHAAALALALQAAVAEIQARAVGR